MVSTAEPKAVPATASRHTSVRRRPQRSARLTIARRNVASTTGYTAPGWEIVEKGYTDIPYGGRSVRAVKIVAELGYEREVILYWFASGGRTEASFVRQQFTMALDRLRTQKYGWAFIRLNSPVLDFYSDEETVEHIRDFLRDASGSLVDVLTSPEVAQTGWLPDG